MDVVKEIKRFNKGREPERLQLKYAHMRANPFVFLRATCHLFYQQLPQSGIFQSAPAVWSCGDLHLENFGSYKGDNRLAYFDINDFDEGVLAPASWDIVRMLTSLRVAAPTLGLKVADANSLCDVFLNAYAMSLQAGKAYWMDVQTGHGLIKQLLETLQARQRLDFLNARTLLKGKKRALRVDGKKALPLTSAQRAQISEFMEVFASQQPNPDFYRMLDGARRVAGTGSLGVARFAILVEGKGGPNGNYILDLKQALKSSLAPYVPIKQPLWETQAHRVVAIQQRMQAVPMAFLQPVLMGQTAYVLRGLQPIEDRVALNSAHHSPSDIQKVVAQMGQLLAWAQLRSSGRQGSAVADELMHFAPRKKWKAKLHDASIVFAQQTEQDAATYAQAYDDGAFDPR